MYPIYQPQTTRNKGCTVGNSWDVLNIGLLKFGVLLGIGAAAPIGPVNVEIARRTLRGGFRAGCALGCGAVSVDVFYAILASQGLRRVLDRPAIMLALGIAGATMLLWLAIMCFRGARHAWHADPITAAESKTATGQSVHAAYVTGVLMTLLNPITLAFWFVAVPGALGPITEEPRRDLPMICAGVFVGTLSWVVFFAGLLALLGRRLTSRRRAAWLAVADLVGGLTLLGFAILALWRLRVAFL